MPGISEKDVGLLRIMESISPAPDTTAAQTGPYKYATITIGKKEKPIFTNGAKLSVKFVNIPSTILSASIIEHTHNGAIFDKFCDDFLNI